MTEIKYYCQCGKTTITKIKNEFIEKYNIPSEFELTCVDCRK